MQRLKCCIKYIVKKVIAALLHIYWVFPVKPNKVLFMNDHSYTFSDNLKYLTLYLLDNNKDNNKYLIYFSLKDSSGTEGKNIKVVKFLSLAHFYHAITSRVLITNNSGISYLPIRKSQLVINTWHGGGPYKVTGVEKIDNRWYEKDLKYNAKKTGIMLSSCEVFSTVEAPSQGFSQNQMMNCGMPRMDFFLNEGFMMDVRKRVTDHYHIPENSKILLYAPTFRGQFESYDNVISGGALELDYTAVLNALKNKFGGEWVFAVRLHPRLKDYTLSDERIVNMTQYQDAEEILMATDVLVTDYSSVMWDFSFSRKPIFLFATDLDDYEVKRGFYIPPEEWPYPIATSNEEMLHNISSYDYDEYIRVLEDHYIKAGSYERGHACEMVKKVIDEYIGSGC